MRGGQSNYNILWGLSADLGNQLHNGILPHFQRLESTQTTAYGVRKGRTSVRRTALLPGVNTGVSATSTSFL